MTTFKESKTRIHRYATTQTIPHREKCERHRENDTYSVYTYIMTILLLIVRENVYHNITQSTWLVNHMIYTFTQ